MKNSKLEKLILKSFFRQKKIKYPLTLTQIGRYLHSPKDKNDLNGTEDFLFQIKELLDRLVKQHILIEQKGLYWLFKGKNISDVSQREVWLSFIQREKVAQRKINLARKALKLFAWIPGLRGLFICGSVARKISLPKSDIDFLILTQKNRTWTTRFFLTMATFFLGHKTTDGKNRRNKFCLNHFRSKNKLSLEKFLQKSYPAEEYAQMINLYSEEKTVKKFYEVNQAWMQRILPNFDFIKPPLYSKKKSGDKTTLLGNWIEKVLCYFQTQKISRNNQRFQKLDNQRIVIDNEVIMFHLNPK